MNPGNPISARRGQPQQVTESDLKAAAYLVDAHRRMSTEMSRVIVGQSDVLDQMLIALFCQGHCVLEGVPGLAKTLMIATLSQLLSLTFRRIQFTPDLMPSDITGTEFLEEDVGTGHRRTKFVKGPIFAHVLLGDEINRTPPKTQAALLQAMQEYKVTVAGVDYALERPFFVLGTQNPIEQEGTYPLPEAQLDRFMFKIHVDYPSYDDELAIAQTTTSEDRPALQPILTREAIMKLQHIVRRVLIGQTVAAYAVQLVRATRPQLPDAPDFVKKYLTWGAGPRACQAILLGAKARALLSGRYHVAVDDIRYVAAPVLRHRLVTSFTAEADGVSADNIVARLCEYMREPMESQEGI
jgi:MoxR-like ATPase